MQLQQKELQRQQEYQAFLREKKMIDEIISTIHEEDERYVVGGVVLVTVVAGVW